YSTSARAGRLTFFPTRRSSDLHQAAGGRTTVAGDAPPGAATAHRTGHDADDGRDVGAETGERDPRADDGQDAHHEAGGAEAVLRDRKSTRLNSSHVKISYAVFC